MLQKKLKFKKLTPTAKLPTRGTDSAAGYDLYLSEDAKITGEHLLGPTMVKFGVAVEIPEGYVGLLTARSSTHKNYEVIQTNSVGIIDSDYRGELKAPYEGAEQTLRIGAKLCQLVIVPVYNPQAVWADELSTTERGEGGFGSTDV